jgi:regulator of cell morphogenesis and NO signaling
MDMSANIDAEQTVRDLVVESPEARPVLERLGIDYCCGGERTLTAAAAAAGVDLAELTDALEAVPPAPSAGIRNWSEATLAALVDHIEQVHHAFMRRSLPRIAALFDKVIAAHGQRHARVLRPLKQVFTALRGEIERHLQKEEHVLFPYVRSLEALAANGSRAFAREHGSIQNPVRVMRLEHDDAGRALARMRALTDGYRLPEDACESFRALYEALVETEGDLHEHIHLENNILFPRAIALENACWGV